MATAVWAADVTLSLTMHSGEVLGGNQKCQVALVQRISLFEKLLDDGARNFVLFPVRSTAVTVAIPLIPLI